MTQSWEASLPTIIQPELYHCDVEQFVKTLRDCPIIAKAILIIGHNPGLEELVQALTNRTESISTATLVQIELDIKEWSEVSLNSNSLLVSIT
ncbi:MAG: hypothetical protein FJ267_16390, partial [Planctomycetes bacterium]|nr:hypothetical protein [Planctomycetota bacterium]